MWYYPKYFYINSLGAFLTNLLIVAECNGSDKSIISVSFFLDQEKEYLFEFSNKGFCRCKVEFELSWILNEKIPIVQQGGKVRNWNLKKLCSLCVCNVRNGMFLWIKIQTRIKRENPPKYIYQWMTLISFYPSH